MLRFTDAQQASILANRRQFNASQRAMASRIGNASMIGNALPLPFNVWGEWDREGIAIQRQVLAVFNDLASSVSRPMPIGKLVHYFQAISDSGSVNISLDGRSKANIDKPTFAYYGTPVPIIDSSFGYGWREVAAAASEGYQLDDAGRTNAMFKVAEKLEGIALDGDSSIVVSGQQLYGLRTHPKRSTRSTGVTLQSATGAQWMSEVIATLKLLQAKNFKSPATLYLNWSDWFYAGNTDFSTTYPNKTILQRIQEIAGVQAVVPADKVSANQIIALVKDRRVVQVLSAMPMVTRAQERDNPEDDYNFVTMAAAAVEIKYDAANNIGLAVSS